MAGEPVNCDLDFNMNTLPHPPHTEEPCSWLVRFQRSRASPDWLIEVKPVGGEHSYRFASQQAWLDWCAEVFERDTFETDLQP